MVTFDMIVLHGSQDRIPTLGFNLAAGAGGAIVLRCHLCQQAVAQAERGVTESRQLAAFEKPSVDRSPRNYNFSPSWANSRELAAILERKLCQFFCHALYLRTGCGRSACAFGL